jgi:hypothetical protein
VRKLFVLTILSGIFCAIAFVFWTQEMKYQLPTAVPVDYKLVLPGHFYNPDCPCSEFNARHIQSLVREYRDSIVFAIVVPNDLALDDAKNEFGHDLVYVTDFNDAVAKACGVYSTPQAAIIDAAGNLFYRGNYNKARYCTTRASNFAELSLIALVNHQPAPAFGLAATQSYGCELPRSTTRIDFFESHP